MEPEVIDNAKETVFSRHNRADAYMTTETVAAHIRPVSSERGKWTRVPSPNLDGMSN